MGEDPCGAGPGDCGDIDDKGPFGTPDTPAGWLILQSFTNFHNVSSFSEMFQSTILVLPVYCFSKLPQRSLSYCMATDIPQFQSNQYSAIGDAQAFVVGQIGAFQAAFAPIDDPESALNIFLDILGLGLSLISAAVWNKGLPLL